MTGHVITEERLTEIIENAYKNGFNDGQADCQQHDTAIRNATINEFYMRIKAERDPSLEYVDWDSIEAVFIRLRGGVK